MKVRVLGSRGDPELATMATTLLIDGRIAMDAGALPFVLTVDEQRAVKDVLISHSHLDHIVGLPLFLDNVFDPVGEQPVRIHGHPETLKALRAHIFNDVIWPDFVRLSEEGFPFLEFCPFEKGVSFPLGDLKVTAIPVPHTVLSHSFLIENEDSACLLVSDTAPTRRLWEIANASKKLSHVFIETSFPDGYEELAHRTKHLTPSQAFREKAKLRAGVTFLAYHLKTQHSEEIRSAITAMNDEDFVVAVVNEDYEI